MRILTASDDGTARLWKTSTEPTLQVLGSAKHTGGATSIDTSADGSLVASGGVDGKVLVWRLGEAECSARSTTGRGSRWWPARRTALAC